MMKKILAAAIVSAFAAPAFAATANVDVYGNLGVSVDFINTDAASPADDKLTRVSSNSSRIGFKGSEDLGGGLSAIWQIENQLNMDGVGVSNDFTGTNNFTSNLRNTFVGLSSKSMGTALLGIHDTPYKLSAGKIQFWGDTSADYNNIVGNVQGSTHFDLRTSNTLAYISPKFGGLSGAVAYVVGNEVNNGAAPDVNAWSASVTYDQGPLFLTAAYEKHNNVVAPTADDRDAFKLGAGYSFGNTKLGLIYEKADSAGLLTVGTVTKVRDRSAWYLNGAHTMGNIVLKAAYGRAGDLDGMSNTGADTWSLGADYNLSKRSYLYAYYTVTNNDSAGTYGVGQGQGSAITAGTSTPTLGMVAGNDPSVFSLGMRHSF